ncbi:fumarylacetoacetate hydrolase family protein [Sphingobium sp. YR768]|uniref:fumarylacetoacetate hydrolase family protein n=1 Tax=Sphingobium sp. YR768 TaxID=1884365 RepID=UPI00210E39AC|nr:fumarylacetoacetate hydrolase family protein [Sphingobium sp. YR768]
MCQVLGIDPILSDVPLMYQGVSDKFYGPRDDVKFPDEALGIDFEGEFGVIVDAVPMGTTADEAIRHIKLIVQINDWSLRALAGPEMKTGFGWIQANPPCAMAPFAVSRIEALEAEHRALNEKPPFISAEQKEKALAYLVIGSDGQPRLHERLFIVPEPEPEVEEAEAEPGADGIQSEEVEQEPVEDGPSLAPISQKLAEELAIMKTEILRLHVASDPHFALDLGTFFMVDAALGRSYGHPSELRATAPYSRVPGFESDTPAGEAWTELDAGLDRSWTEAGNLVERYDAFCGLDEGARAAWLGWAIARTLHAVPVGGTGADLIDHLGRKLEIEEHVWWRPTARRYFDRVSKGRILAHFGEVGGLELSNRYAASKKHDLAASAEKLFAGQLIVEAEVKDRALNWLPDEMRFGRAEHPDCEGSETDGDGLHVEAADGAVSENADDGFLEAA